MTGNNREEKFKNKTIAEILRDVAAVYLLKNVIRFRRIAYENAADTIERMNRELKDVWQEGKLDTVPGIGPSIASYLDEYFRKGRSAHFDKVLAKIPQTVFILMRISLIGPKRAFKLVKALNLNNPRTVVRDLKKACLKGKVAELESFGEKSQEDILLSIQLYEQSTKKTERMPLPYAFSLAEETIEYLKKMPEVKRVDALGSLRRMVATVGDVDLSVAADDKNADKIIKHFVNFPRVINVENAGGKKASIIVSPNVRIDLRIQNEQTYGSMLQYFTGSKSHNINLREYALKKGLSLSEYGMKKVRRSEFGVRSSERFEFKDEESLYGFLGLQYIPPEIREGTNEIEIALKYKLPELVEQKDIKGDFHLHSSYDLKPSHDYGVNTFEEMMEKAAELGYEYIGFSEHNPNTGNNTNAEIIEILKKRKEHMNYVLGMKKYPVKYFIGLEVDIAPNGQIAFPEKALPYVDYLIVSVHSSFRMKKKEMTERILKGLSYPKVKILGHPTGRLFGKREGYELDWDKIFTYAKKKNIALEINSGPDRLDLTDTLVRSAVQNGNKLVINTDAHAAEYMDGLKYGISVARRGWATKGDIINIGGYNEVRGWIFE